MGNFVVGHELGHAVLNENDVPGGNNVQNLENPIRKGVGEAPRLKYRGSDVPQEQPQEQPNEQPQEQESKQLEKVPYE